LVQGLATKQEKIDSLSNINLTGIDVVNAQVSGELLVSGRMTVLVPNTKDVVSAEIGSGATLLRFTHGNYIDSITRSNGAGRTLLLNYLSNAGVRIGDTTGGKLSINCNESAYQLDVAGAGRFSGSLVASNFPSSSDARLKTEVEPASLDECTRLVKAVTPCTYKRIDMAGNPARCGYIAQQWDRELTGGYRCIMGASEDENGPLLAIDYSRIVPILHAALLSALKRIEALESRA
jgi:hypothetical protein